MCTATTTSPGLAYSIRPFKSKEADKKGAKEVSKREKEKWPSGFCTSMAVTFSGPQQFVKPPRVPPWPPLRPAPSPPRREHFSNSGSLGVKKRRGAKNQERSTTSSCSCSSSTVNWIIKWNLYPLCPLFSKSAKSESWKPRGKYDTGRVSMKKRKTANIALLQIPLKMNGLLIGLNRWD